MTTRTALTALAGAMTASALIAGTALAHHGWNWAEDGQIELTGTIVEIYVGPPHPTLQVETESDGVWTVELGNPNQTARAGFDADTAAPGDSVTAIGNRSAEPGETRMKAVRIVIDGTNYDFYPARIQED